MPDFLNLNQQNIKYLDALTYVTIRSFHNSTTGLCYPAYETIADKAGMSRSFIINSVKRLEKGGFLNITHSKKKHTCNQYHFDKEPRFERIPYELLDADLSANQKAMLICLRQFFNEGPLSSTKTITDFAKLLGISYKTVYSQFIELIAKGFINEKYKIMKGQTKSLIWLKLSDKIDWHYDYSKSKPKQAIVYPKLRVA
ncbi:helix-turn-helix domain-containing protein [Mucilaginibacter sp. RCC_168]